MTPKLVISEIFVLWFRVSHYEMLGPTHSWTPHSVGPWQYLGCSGDTYYLYIVVIRMTYCTCREKYYLFLCYFLQPKGVMWTTRKQDFQDSRKVHCNWNHSFLLNCQISHRRWLCSRDLAFTGFWAPSYLIVTWS